MFYPEFYPTPSPVIHQMLSLIDSSATCWLEPSAGKGNIAEAIRYRSKRAQIDVIEQNPELAATLIGKEFSLVGHDWLEYDGVSYYDAIVMNPPFSNPANCFPDANANVHPSEHG